jgi:hypothetical protein
MSMEFPETFDPDTQEGNSWDLLPDGEYVAQAIEAKVAQPQSGDGYGLTLTWRILEGDYEGRQIWQYITYLHSSEQAQSIGRKTIKDLCVAFGVNEHIENAEVFLFKPARIRVGIERDKNGVYDDKNKIKRVMALDTDASSSGGTAAKVETPRAQPRPGPAGDRPWHNKR